MKRTPLTRKTPLCAKAGLKGGGTIKRKRNKRLEASNAEQRHIDRVAVGACIGCGSHKDIVVHHIMHAPGKTKRRDHRYVARLCAQCHNMGNRSVHLLGSERAFLEATGVDLVAWAMAQWDKSCALEQQ